MRLKKNMHRSKKLRIDKNYEKGGKKKGKSKGKGKNFGDDEPGTSLGAPELPVVRPPIEMKISGAESCSFSSVGVENWLITQCSQMGISRPSPVQANCIPEVGLASCK